MSIEEFFPMIFFNKKGNEQPCVIFKKEEYCSINSIEIDTTACRYPLHTIEIYAFDEDETLVNIQFNTLNSQSSLFVCNMSMTIKRQVRIISLNIR